MNELINVPHEEMFLTKDKLFQKIIEDILDQEVTAFQVRITYESLPYPRKR